MKFLHACLRSSFCAFFLLAASSIFTAAMAATLASYDLNFASGSTAPSATVEPGFTVTPLTMTGASNAAFSNHFYFQSWDTTLNPAKYLTLTINSPATYRLLNIAFSVESGSIPSSASVIVRSSADGFAANIDSFAWTGELVTDGQLNLSAIGARTGATELRFYFTTSSNFLAGFANHELPGSGGGLPDIGRDITLTGVLSTPAASIPTLSEWGLIGLSTTLTLFAAFRMRRRQI